MPKNKIEITVIDGDWQWMGLLTDEQLTKLCAYADQLNSEEHSDE